MVEQIMTEQKRQTIADLMDGDLPENGIDQLVAESEMRSIWSRFHLVRDILKGEVPVEFDLNFAKNVEQAILSEPSLLIPSAAKQLNKSKSAKKPSTVVVNLKSWAEQATGLAIAASVTAIMVFGIQTLNTPNNAITPISAITSLEFIEVDNIKIASEHNYSVLQESLIDYTKNSSEFGLQDMTPYVSLVNHQVEVPLTLIKSNYDSILKAKEEAKIDTSVIDSSTKEDTQSDQ